MLCLIIIHVTVNVQAASYTAPSYYEDKISDTLLFKADIILPNSNISTILPKIKIDYLPLDYKVSLEEFFSDVNIVQEEKYISDFTDRITMYVSGEKGEILVNEIDLSRVYIEKPEWQKTLVALELSPKDLNYNLNVYSRNVTLPFATVEDVNKVLEDKLTKLGVTSNYDQLVYTIDYETMKQESTEDLGWSEYDSGYLFVMNQTVENIPVYSWYYYGTGIEAGPETSDILIFYTKDGIRMAEISGIFDSIIYEENKWELLPFETIVETLVNRFSLAVSSNIIEIQSMKFAYMTEQMDKQYYELIPVWFCNYTSTGADGISMKGQVILNASNAEELVYELY